MAAAIALPPPPPAPDPLLSLHEVSLSHSKPPALTLQNVTLTLRPGMRLVLVGPNGSGKSLLLQGLAGVLRPRSGKRQAGRWLQLLNWDQGTRTLGSSGGGGGSGDDGGGGDEQEVEEEEEEEEETPLTFVQRLAGGCLDDDSALESLTALGLDKWAARRACCCLSAGERTIVALAALTIAPKNLLLLDEPAAFLGSQAVEDVAGALHPERWPGTLVVASCNRRFCEALAPTHVARVGGGRVRVFDRPPSDSDFSLDWLAEEQAVAAGEEQAAEDRATAEAQRSDKRSAARGNDEPREDANDDGHHEKRARASGDGA